MTNHIQKNDGKDYKASQNLDDQMTDVPVFVVQGSSSTSSSDQDNYQKQQVQQQQAQPQQHQGSATVDAFKGKWQQQVGAAKVMWGKLTDDELLKTEGHAQKLAGLVQERYAISRREADKQVNDFIAKCKC